MIGSVRRGRTVTSPGSSAAPVITPSVIHPTIPRAPAPPLEQPADTATVSTASLCPLNQSEYPDTYAIIFADDCCVKVSASKLLEHWLDAPGPPDTSSPAGFPAGLLQQEDPLPAIRSFFRWSATQAGSLLHLVLSKHSSLPTLPALVRLLVTASPSDALVTDDHGDTALTMVRHLLEAGEEKRAQEVAGLLLEHGAAPGHTNMCGWSLLAYSLSYQDASIELTRTLLNHGVSILPASSTSVPASSPFRVFLSSVVRAQSLTGASETLSLLGQVMGRSPARMKAHVLASLVAEGRYHNLQTLTVFQEVKETLDPYWNRPSSLLHLSLHASRRRLGLKRLNCGKLPVAPRLANYLSYRLTLRCPPRNGKSQDSDTQKTEPIQYQEDLLSSRIRMRLAAS